MKTPAESLQSVLADAARDAARAEQLAAEVSQLRAQIASGESEERTRLLEELADARLTAAELRTQLDRVTAQHQRQKHTHEVTRIARMEQEAELAKLRRTNVALAADVTTFKVECSKLEARSDGLLTRARLAEGRESALRAHLADLRADLERHALATTVATDELQRYRTAVDDATTALTESRQRQIEAESTALLAGQAMDALDAQLASVGAATKRHQEVVEAAKFYRLSVNRPDHPTRVRGAMDLLWRALDALRPEPGNAAPGDHADEHAGDQHEPPARE
jgi:chromosome segregation ATPase